MPDGSLSPKETSRLVIFDLDGTLVDAFDDIRAALNHGLAHVGIAPKDPASVRGWVGNGLPKLCSRALGPDNQHLAGRVLAACREYYADHPADNVTMYPGMRETLLDLRRLGCAIAVLTNKPEELAIPVAESLGFLGLLDGLRGAREGTPVKPHPAGLEALRQIAPRAEVFVVGDGLPDGQIAQNAGARFVGVSWGVASAAELETYGPVAHSAGQITQIIING